MPRKQKYFPGYRFNTETGERKLFQSEAEVADAGGEWVRHKTTPTELPKSRVDNKPTSPGYDELTTTELRQIAVDKGYEDVDSATREQLITTLKADDADTNNS